MESWSMEGLADVEKKKCVTEMTPIPILLSAVVFSCWELLSFKLGKNNNSKDRDSDSFLTFFCVFIRFLLNPSSKTREMTVT